MSGLDQIIIYYVGFYSMLNWAVASGITIDRGTLLLTDTFITEKCTCKSTFVVRSAKILCFPIKIRAAFLAPRIIKE